MVSISMEEKDYFAQRIRELIRVSFARDVVTFSDFLSLQEQQEVPFLAGKKTGVSVATFGGYEGAERVMAAFYPQGMEEPQREEYPLTCLCIAPKNPKFAGNLTHRDYLGALLHLGVEREVIGDILVGDGKAYCFCRKNLESFFTTNLDRIAHTAVVCTEAEGPEEIYLPRLSVVEGTVSSLRLDSLLSLGFQKSRSSLSGAFSSGLVFVNGKECQSPSYVPKEGDIISLRGSGRFTLLEEGRLTKKGRLSVKLGKYV